MVRGRTTAHKMNTLVVVRGNLTRIRYQDIVHQHVVSSNNIHEHHRHQCILQQIKAMLHVATEQGPRRAMASYFIGSIAGPTCFGCKRM